VLERPLTAPTLQFKGAGWYVNDYASKSAASSSGDNPSATAAPAAETKPAAAEPSAKPATPAASA